MGFKRGWAIAVTVAALALPAAAQDASMMRYFAFAKSAAAPTLVERYGPDDQRLGQLRLPAGKGPFPVAVIIHGGCWSAGYDSVAGTAGIATWNIEYRSLGHPGGGWPGTFEDIAAGIDHLAALAKRQPLDLEQVTIIGHSAGAHLALWGASRSRLGSAYAPKVTPVSVVAIDGPGALAPFIGVDSAVCGKPVIVPFMGGDPKSRPEAYAIATPADHLPLGVKQLFVFGALTPMMTGYADAAAKSGDRVATLRAGSDHFAVVTPDQPDGAKVIDFIVGEAFAK
jgi:acetyl esterase/lipase